ncbi:DUF2946 family protein [Comamonadaceae bacterium PP-2]
MRSFRSFPLLIRAVLAWFALTVAIATASPLVHKPDPLHTVCTASGEVRVLNTDAGHAQHDAPAAGHPHGQLDCPLCLLAKAPPPASIAVARLAPSALAHALRPARRAHLATSSGAPLPPRGPPTRRA